MLLCNCNHLQAGFDQSVAHFRDTVRCGQQVAKFPPDCRSVGCLNDGRVGQNRNKTINVNTEIAVLRDSGVSIFYNKEKEKQSTD